MFSHPRLGKVIVQGCRFSLTVNSSYTIAVCRIGTTVCVNDSIINTGIRIRLLFRYISTNKTPIRVGFLLYMAPHHNVPTHITMSMRSKRALAPTRNLQSNEWHAATGEYYSRCSAYAKTRSPIYGESVAHLKPLFVHQHRFEFVGIGAPVMEA